MRDGSDGPEAWSRLLVRLYPRELRARFGDELRSALEASLRRERAEPGVRFMVLRVIWDVLRSAVALRAGWRRPAMKKRDGWEAIERSMKPTGRGGRTMEGWGQASRIALRGMRRRPGFAITAVATVALGIGASSTVFSLVYGVLLKPMPYEEPRELVYVWGDFSSIGIPRAWLSGPQTVRLEREADLFEGFAVLRATEVDLDGSEGEPPQRVRANTVTWDLFEILGVKAALGRTFAPADQGEGAAGVVILDHGLWTQRFGADPGIVGRRIRVDQMPREVIGIMPKGFEFRMHSSLGNAQAPDLWIPFDQDLSSFSAGNHMFAALGRMRDGVSIEQARAQLQAIGRRYGQEAYGQGDFRLYPVALHQDLVKEVRPALLTLTAGVALLLLIVAANLATLFLGRAAAREQDVAVRTALGAGRASIMGLVLVEVLLIAVLGGVLGLILSAWTLDLFLGLVPGDIPRSEDVSVSGAVAGVTVLVTLVLGLATGLLPALKSSRPVLATMLREGGARGGQGREKRLLQRGLVVGQVTLSALLLTGAGLLGRSLANLFEVDPGFEAAGVITASVSLPPGRYPDGSDRLEFMDRAMERLQALPGVAAVGITSTLPLSASANQTPMELGAAEVPPTDGDGSADSTDWWRATPGFVEALGLRVLDGRAFRPEDRDQDVVMIDEVMARRYWPTTSPVGAHINRDSVGAGGDRIVGVVSHARLYNVYEDDRGQAIFPMATGPARSFDIAVRAEGAPAATAEEVRTVLSDLDPALPVELGFMEEAVSASLARWRFSLLLMAAFAVAALFLAGLGVYGVVSYAVTRRTRELGIRMALGADRSEVARMVVRQGVGLVLVGLVAGLMASVGLGRFLGALLYGVSPGDLVTAASVGAVLLAVAWGSSALPARRATRISPTEAFRAE